MTSPSLTPPPADQPDLLVDELDAALAESLRFAQNFAERMRLARMQVIVSRLRSAHSPQPGG